MLLRFVVADPGGGAARLEASFGEFRARATAVPRMVGLAVLGLAYGVYFGVWASYAALQNGWVYLGMSVLCFVLVPVMRMTKPLWAVDAAAAAAAAAVLSVFNVNDSIQSAPTVCTAHQYSALMGFSMWPLACGVIFAPRWRWYAVMCAAHTARGYVTLAPLGGTPFLIVIGASVIGTVMLYLQERNHRITFVRAPRARARALLVG